MSDKPPRKPIGRPVVDDKGNRTWTWNDEKAADTATVRALGEDLSLDKSADEERTASENPYDRGGPPAPDKDQPRRRTLDDMRRLSEQIKRSKNWKRDK